MELGPNRRESQFAAGGFWVIGNLRVKVRTILVADGPISSRTRQQFLTFNRKPD